MSRFSSGSTRDEEEVDREVLVERALVGPGSTPAASRSRRVAREGLDALGHAP